jgi:peptide chain release factor subunit 1
MVADKVRRDPPQPGQATALEVERFDAEHPKKPLPTLELSTTTLDDAMARLTEFESPDAPVVSLYWDVPADPGQIKAGVASLKDLAKTVREHAMGDGVSHEASASLRADADRIADLEGLVAALHGRTLALFLCHHQGLEQAVVLPGGVAEMVEIDARPFIRPLVEVKQEAHRYAVVVVDREHGTLFDFYLGELVAVERQDGRALRNPNYAPNDSEYGVHHKEEELLKRHYRETAAALAAFVQEKGIDLVVVGGHQESVPGFLDALPKDLREMVVGTFALDRDAMTPGLIREAAQRAVDEYERREEEELLSQALDAAAAGGRGAVGLEWCLLATNERAVDCLLVDAGATAPGRVCDRCGWLGTGGDTCPVDGNATRAVPDVINEMVRQVVDSSGRVVHLHGYNRLGEDLTAALLRFAVPKPEALQA